MAKAVRLHDYQTEIKTRLSEEWSTHRSVMVQMPTGTGKTHVLAAVVKDCLTPALSPKREGSDMPAADESGRKPICGMQSCHKGSVWIVAHRRELVEQIKETLLKYGIDTADGHVKVLSIQWLSRHWDEAGTSPHLIIIDEAHHAQANTYRMLWDRCPRAKFLGLTATPCRMSRSGFTDLFDVLITSWSIAEFIGKGRLSTFDYVSIRPDSRAQQLINSLKKRGADGDYQIKEMNDTLNRRQSIGQLYQSIRKYAGGRKGIVYAISISHARSIAEYYSLHGISAVAIDSKTPAAERKQLVGDFKAGKIQVLVNVDVFSEGFDCPDVEFVQMARPTLSLSKYLQQVGRGLRKSEGKEACILIDNVGLYRVFGLPTAAWDWESMFRGDTAGKGTRTAVSLCCGISTATVQREDVSSDCDMELIVSHDKLLSTLAHPDNAHPASPQKRPELKAWQEEDSGLWGLKAGRRKITEAVFITVFDIRYDMAAVRLGNKTCALINNAGDTVWEKENYQSLKFARNHILVIRTREGKECYMDLRSLRIYNVKPEIKRYGEVEMLKIGHTYYSRTKVVYENSQNLNSRLIMNHGFCITVLDYKMPNIRGTQRSDTYRCGYACILNDDYESFYWVYRWLADGSVIVTDSRGRFYNASEGRKKEYIGCIDTSADRIRCQAGIGRVTKRADRFRLAVETEEKEKRQQILSCHDEAIPFRSGMKWGLKVGGRVTVPPIYRNIKSPVGKYCAVEKNYSQWGVIALDGTLMIEPQYSDIEIKGNGSVIGTKVTGRKMSVKLP